MNGLRRSAARLRGRLPSVPFRVQTILIVGAAVVSVAVLLIFLQGESINQEVIKERAAGISRVAGGLEARAARAAASGGRLYQRADLQQRLPDVAREIGAQEVLVVNRTGHVIAASDAALIGTAYGDGIVGDALREGAETWRQVSGSAFVFALPFRLAGDEQGAFVTRVDLASLQAAIDAATSRSLLPSLLVLLISLPLALVVSNRILSRTYEREQQLRLETRFGSMVRNSSDLLLIIDADALVAYASPSIERILGLRPAAVVGVDLAELVVPDDSGGLRDLLLSMRRGSGPARTEFRIRRADGSIGHFEAYCTNLLGDPSVHGIVLNARDVSERKELEEQLSHQAFHDPLTDLPNRALFKDRVQHALDRGRRDGTGVAALFIDLDNFKTVNDSLGHEAGDRLLVGVAARLRRVLRTSDTAARLGGDEFGLLLEEIEASTAERAALRIRDALADPFLIDGQEVFTSASIGIAVAGPGAEDVDGLLRSADIAMYRAKQAGVGHFRKFEPAMHAAARDRLELDADLRRALERGELHVEYQPIVSVRQRQIVGAEALLRWHHPRRGEVSPNEIIPLAEQTGLIVPIGRHVLEVACRQAVAWDALGPPRLGSVSVNVSGRQLQDARFVRDVAAALDDAGLGPERLVLEITEGALVQDTEATLARLGQLKELGVRLAIDDFGTGYSSLSYLRAFPIDLLKVDRSFIAPVRSGRDAFALAQAIVRLARSLGLATVAEGVESLDQADALTAIGCDFAQGYHFGRPSSAVDFPLPRQPAADVA
ncbi:MAG TPA: EAL domain-containing protein [Candidatus Limnocylindrales bacterium]|nr:EAL domain-containing protein [Candidatus Limnocylindrales bacterium]